MRHVLATPSLPYFHTTYLFYPFGTTIADHPHTALPALVAATLLKSLSVVTAQNVLLLAYVFLNMACMYALAWTVTRHARAAIVGAVVFGLSPYVAVHLLGHFDLVAAWPLPLFALALRQSLAMSGGSYAIFLHRPIAVTMFAIAAALVLLALKPLVFKSKDWRADVGLEEQG